MSTEKQLSKPFNKGKLIIDYHNFVVSTFGEEVWQEICSKKIQGRYISHLIHEYGNVIFHDLVNYTCTIQKVEIKEILANFYRAS